MSLFALYNNNHSLSQHVFIYLLGPIYLMRLFFCKDVTTSY